MEAARFILSESDHPFVQALPLAGPQAAENFFSRGVRLHTRYSGLGMAEVVCHRLHAGLVAAAEEQEMCVNLGSGVTAMDAWDCKSSAQSILCSLEEGMRPAHVFTDMQLRHRKSVLDTITGLEVAAGGDRALFWRDLVALLLEIDRTTEHALKSHAKCLLHPEGDCPVPGHDPRF